MDLAGVIPSWPVGYRRDLLTRLAAGSGCGMTLIMWQR